MTLYVLIIIIYNYNYIYMSTCDTCIMHIYACTAPPYDESFEKLELDQNGWRGMSHLQSYDIIYY